MKIEDLKINNSYIVEETKIWYVGNKTDENGETLYGFRSMYGVGTFYYEEKVVVEHFKKVK